MKKIWGKKTKNIEKNGRRKTEEKRNKTLKNNGGKKGEKKNRKKNEKKWKNIEKIRKT